MKYFAYKPSKTIGKVFRLFDKLGDLSEGEILKQESLRYTHTCDIIASALNGNIDLSDDKIRDFNLAGYEYKCTKTSKLAEKNNTKKELFIVPDVTVDEEATKTSFGDVSERRLHSVNKAEELFDKVLDEESFYQNLDALYSIRTPYIVEKGVDIVNLLYSAITGVKDADKLLSEYTKKDSNLNEIINGVCLSEKHDLLVGRLKVS